MMPVIPITRATRAVVIETTLHRAVMRPRVIVGEQSAHNEPYRNGRTWWRDDERWRGVVA